MNVKSVLPVLMIIALLISFAAVPAMGQSSPTVTIQAAVGLPNTGYVTVNGTQEALPYSFTPSAACFSTYGFANCLPNTDNLTTILTDLGYSGISGPKSVMSSGQNYVLQSASAVYNPSSRADVVTLVYFYSSTQNGTVVTIEAVDVNGSPIPAHVFVNGTSAPTPYSFSISFSWGLNSQNEPRILANLVSFGIDPAASFLVAATGENYTLVAAEANYQGGVETIVLTYSGSSPSTTANTICPSLTTFYEPNSNAPFLVIIIILGEIATAALALTAIAVIFDTRKRKVISSVPSLKAILTFLDPRKKRSMIAVMGGILYSLLFGIENSLEPSGSYPALMLMLQFFIFVLIARLLYEAIQPGRLSPSRLSDLAVRGVSVASAVVLGVLDNLPNFGYVLIVTHLPATSLVNDVLNIAYAVTVDPIFAAGLGIRASFTILYLLWALVFAVLMRLVKTQR
jgi:hypothetical protein